jgi:probable S-adenosylmethionine-dependent methyltransferase, YraL family|tara:strand:- start:1238 stop:2092 length:855 start_codon:yes stop_codon:yes gene_type:complete
MNLQSKNNKSNLRTGLYLVSTPIGNMADISYRAISVLKNSNLILCEDTRVSKKLISKYSINSNLISYHKFNEKKSIEKILIELKSNKIISLISDAGTPTISDPGKVLVQACIKENINIVPVPGSSAVTAALSISGFSEKYFFYGFFPEKKSEIKENLSDLSNLNCSIVFFISAKKLNRNLNVIKEFFSERNIVICKEITKYYEEFFRSKVSDLKAFKNLKGEITIVISELNNKKKASNNLNESDKKKIGMLIKKLSTKEIVNLLNYEKNISKKEIYNYCLSLKK